MGQSISVAVTSVDDFCVFTTDRVLTGQDGERFESSAESDVAECFAATLASRLFSSDAAIQKVWVAASEVVVGRSGGWNTAATAAAQQVVTDLYRYYL